MLHRFTVFAFTFNRASMKFQNAAEIFLFPWRQLHLPSPCCVIHIILTLNPKHSTVPAAHMKINNHSQNQDMTLPCVGHSFC